MATYLRNRHWTGLNFLPSRSVLIYQSLIHRSFSVCGNINLKDQANSQFMATYLRYRHPKNHFIDHVCGRLNLPTNHKHIMRPGPYEILLKFLSNVNVEIWMRRWSTYSWQLIFGLSLLRQNCGHWKYSCRSMKSCFASIEHNKTETTDKRVRILKLMC